MTVLSRGTRAVVYTSDRSDAYGSHGWEEQPGLDAVVTHKRGALPSECYLTVRRDPADPGPLYPALAGSSEIDRVPSGDTGRILHPFGLRRHTFVKVQAQGYLDDKPRTLFLGRVWKYRVRGRSEAVTICHDYRRELARIRCRGSRWRRPAAGDEVFIPYHGPHFNADGRPDQRYIDATEKRDPSFITPGYNRYDTGQIDPDLDCAVFWRCGDALNCLRDLFNADAQAALESTADFLTWPEATAAGDWGYLFEDPVTGDERRVVDLNCLGHSLGWAIDRVVTAAGDADWYLSYGADDKARIEVYSQNTILAGAPEYMLEMGDLGSQDPKAPDVLRLDLEWDWTEAYASVHAVGAREVYDVTLDTSAGTPTLAPGWSTLNESEWEALPESTDAQKREKLAAYPDVFCTWVAPNAQDWSAFFGATAKYREGPRRALGELASYSVDEQEAADRPIGLRLIVWRSTDGGSTWQRLPGQVQAVPLRDRVGFRLPTSVRQSMSYGGEGAYVLSHNAGTAYDMRVTICVEADERLTYSQEEAALVDWPAGELYLPAGTRYRYEARRKCVVPTDGGSPVLNSQTFTELGAAADDVIQNDLDELATLCLRRLDQVSRPMLRGRVPLKYIRTEYAPGAVLKSINFGGAIGEIDIGQSISEVTWDFRAQTTKLSLAGV